MLSGFWGCKMLSGGEKSSANKSIKADTADGLNSATKVVAECRGLGIANPQLAASVYTEALLALLEFINSCI